MQTIVIIGAGFSGSLTAVHLIRLLRGKSVRLVLVERAEKFGPGLAYGQGTESVLLNVVAGRMSALAEDGGHFYRWAKERHVRGGGGGGVTPEMFLPRLEYGRYLADVLTEAVRGVVAPMVFERVRDEVVGVEPPSADGKGMVVRCRSGGEMRADAVVVAVGNAAPSQPGWAQGAVGSSGRYVGNPWETGGLELIRPEDGVVVMGTGLTMMDVVLTLRERGHVGRVVAVSRRGLLPQSHRDPTPGRSKLPEPLFTRTFPRTLELLRALRAEVEREEASGGDWRDVINAMRPVTPALWMALGEKEQQRFMEHVLPFWSTHRHRAAPAVGDAVQRLVDSGDLEVCAGRIVGVTLTESGLDVTIEPRGAGVGGVGGQRVVHADHLINCTGPVTDLRKVGGVVKALMARGMVRPGPLGMGLDFDDSGAVVGADGVVNRGMVLVGPARMGRWFEATAVPELRVQAARAAEVVAGYLAGIEARGMGGVEVKGSEERVEKRVGG